MEEMNKKVSEAAGSDFSTLSEDCIVYILAMTSPLDVCRIRAVARWLLPAVDSDALWRTFLPDDYEQIVAGAVESSALADYSSKKELFFRLCDSDHPVLIDQAKKMFWLEKHGGKKCFRLSARELTIIWGDTPQYWRWFSVPESRFSEIAYLNHVCWLQIKGVISSSMMSPETNYAAYFVFNFSENSYGFGDVEVKSSIKMEGDEDEVMRKSYYLQGRVVNRGRRALMHSSQGQGQGQEQEQEHILYPTRRNDGWFEIELGHFFSTAKRGEDRVQVEITQLGSHWKRGLMVEGIEIRPKHHDA